MLRVRSLFGLLPAALPVVVVVFGVTPLIQAQDSECGTVTTPEVVEAELKRMQEAPLLAVDDTTWYYVPVSMHVVNRSDGTGGLPEQRVIQTLHDLNMHYAQVKIRFFQIPR